MTDPADENPRSARRAPSGASRFSPPASVESLLASGSVIRYLESRIHGALAPWLSSLSREEIAWVRARLFVELTMDPVLRGLVAKVAQALTQARKPGGRPSRTREDGGRLM
jgi:hypothetical protein